MTLTCCESSSKGSLERSTGVCEEKEAGAGGGGGVDSRAVLVMTELDIVEL